MRYMMLRDFKFVFSVALWFPFFSHHPKEEKNVFGLKLFTSVNSFSPVFLFPSTQQIILVPSLCKVQWQVLFQ